MLWLYWQAQGWTGLPRELLRELKNLGVLHILITKASTCFLCLFWWVHASALQFFLTHLPLTNKAEFTFSVVVCCSLGLHINPSWIIALKQLSSLNCVQASKEFYRVDGKVGIELYQQHTLLTHLSLTHQKCHSWKMKSYHQAYLSPSTRLWFL